MGSFNRITHERRRELLERMEKDGLEPKAANYDAIYRIAGSLAKDGEGDQTALRAYAKGFARGLCAIPSEYASAVGHAENLGFANGLNTRRMLDGKLSMELESGRPR